MEDQLATAQAEIERLLKTVLDLKAKTFFLEQFSADPQSITFYMGFKDYKTLVAVVAICNTLKPTATSVVRWT